MTRLTAKDFDQELLDLYDFYAHGKISKREFLESANKFAIGGLTTATILGILSPNYAYAEQVSFNDSSIDASYVEYSSPKGNGKVKGYLVKPKKIVGKISSVLVVHENRGLNPYIEDVTRRIAKAGFLAFAPDGLTSKGGYPGNDEKGKELQSEVDPIRLMNDFFAGFEYLRSRNDATGKVGCVGFCYGGGVCNALAAAYPELSASVPVYGRQAAEKDVSKIKAPLLLHYAELDKRINEGWPTYEAALKKHKKNYTAYIYPKVNHGFHNDSTPRYDEKTAKLAWDRTVEFFKKYLS